MLLPLQLTFILFTVIHAQQTFQNARFDLPADLPVEDPLVLSQLEGVSTHKVKNDLKPVKLKKPAQAAVSKGSAQPPHPVVPLPATPVQTPAAPAQAALPGLPPMPALPTLAPFTLPTFSFPPHPTFAPFTFPSHAPFTFPPHPSVTPFTFAPPAQPVVGAATSAPVPQASDYDLPFDAAVTPVAPTVKPVVTPEPAPQQIQPQPPQQAGPQNQVYPPQPAVNQPYWNNRQPVPQNQQPPTGPQPNYPYQQPNQPNRYPPQQSQFNQVPNAQQTLPQQQRTHFPAQTQFRQPTAQQQLPAPSQHQYVPNQRNVYVPNQQTGQRGLNPSSQQPLRLQPPNAPQQPIVPQPARSQVNLAPTLEASHSRHFKPTPIPSRPRVIKMEKVDETASSDPSTASNWFSENFDTTACRANLSEISGKFKSKFPTYLQKGGKDAALAELVEQRLVECDRKSTSGHWNKVDSLLTKIQLSKSEEADCRSGLIQERISCQNLLNFACQFIQKSYRFKLVPARMTIQEARQAENGAEKCRKVVRLVKKRLEG